MKKRLTEEFCPKLAEAGVIVGSFIRAPAQCYMALEIFRHSKPWIIGRSVSPDTKVITGKPILPSNGSTIVECKQRKLAYAAMIRELLALVDEKIMSFHCCVLLTNPKTFVHDIHSPKRHS